MTCSDITECVIDFLIKQREFLTQRESDGIGRIPKRLSIEEDTVVNNTQVLTVFCWACMPVLHGCHVGRASRLIVLHVF